MANVIVTGGSRGIGLGICRRLARSGFDVIAVARRESEALRQAVENAHGGASGRIRFEACDLADIEALPGFVKAVRGTHGPIWGLVNNAGIGTAGILASLRDSDIEQLVRMNTLSPIVLTRHVLRSMLTGNGGRIVNVSSIVAATGYSGLSVYSATKASLGGFTRSLAREVGSLGITVNAIAPGFVATEMTHGLDQADREKIARRSALRRMPEIDDVAELSAYLFSEAARNITGQVLTVDAGNTV